MAVMWTWHVINFGYVCFWTKHVWTVMNFVELYVVLLPPYEISVENCVICDLMYVYMLVVV